MTMNALLDWNRNPYLRGAAAAILIASLVCPAAAWGHQQWLAPNFFFSEDDTAWVTFDQTFGDRRFLPSSGPGAYFHLWFVSPDLRKRSVPSLFVDRTRTVGELELTEPGTYRLEAEESNMAWTQLKIGDSETWQPGPRSAFPGQEILQSKIYFNKALAYVTLREASRDVLAASGDPIEIVFGDHPNELRAGSAFQIAVHGSGEPLSGHEVRIYSDGTTGHDPTSTCETTTSGTCEIVLDEAGRYLLTSELERPTPDDPDSDGFSLRVSVMVEVGPKE